MQVPNFSLYQCVLGCKTQSDVNCKSTSPKVVSKFNFSHCMNYLKKKKINLLILFAFLFIIHIIESKNSPGID